MNCCDAYKHSNITIICKNKILRMEDSLMRGWSVANQTDYSGFQIEIAFFFTIFCVMAIWVFYDSGLYFVGVKRHVFWVLTIITGPIALITYLIIRRREE